MNRSLELLLLTLLFQGIKDAQNIKDVASKNYYACIVGKAYYEGKVDLRRLLHAYKTDNTLFGYKKW